MSDVTIKTNANGPLLVSGAVTLTDHEGGVYDLGGKDVIALCRCNASKNRPFCDGGHRECGFEAADLAPKE
jgi:CDGSH-type Zn-finger protein